MNDFSQNKKYNNILLAAQMLFWKYGYKKVSIEEICREAKTSKVTFYKFFANKIEIAKAVLDFVVANSTRDFKEMTETATSTSELFEGLLKMKKDGVHDISKEFLADFYADTTLGLKEYIGAKTQDIRVEMLSDFKRLQGKGLIRKDINIEFFLFLAQTLSGLLDDPYALSLFQKPEDMIMEFTNLFTYGMMPYKA